MRRKEKKTGPAYISLWCFLSSLVKCCGDRGLSRDVHFGWLWAICPSSHQKVFSPLPMQTNACMSACSHPFQHPWRSWSRDSLGGYCPQLPNRWQQFFSKLGRAGAGSWRRAPDVWVCCATSPALGVGSWRAPLRHGFPKKQGIIFEVWAFWMQNLFPSCALALLRFCFYLPGLLLVAFSECCRLQQGRKEREKSYFCTGPGWLVASHLAVLTQSKISSEFQLTIIFLHWKSTAGSLLWGLGIFPYCCFLFVGLLEICCKSTGERWS